MGYYMCLDWRIKSDFLSYFHVLFYLFYAPPGACRPRPTAVLYKAGVNILEMSTLMELEFPHRISPKKSHGVTMA